MTENGNLVIELKFAGKILWNHIFWRVLAIWNHCAPCSRLFYSIAAKNLCASILLYNTDFFKDQLTERILAFNNIVKFKFRAKKRGCSVASTVIFFLRPTRPIWSTR